MVLDSIRVQSLHYLTVAWVKMSLGVDISSSVQINNKKKGVLILGICLTHGFGDTTLSVDIQLIFQGQI